MPGALLALIETCIVELLRCGDHEIGIGQVGRVRELHLTVVRYSCIFAVLLRVAFKAAMDAGCRPQPTGVHSVAMMNVRGKIAVECVPDQEVSGSSPIVPVDSRFPFSPE